MFQRVDFEDGDFDLVILPMCHYQHVAALHQQFKAQLEGVYTWMTELDSSLFPIYHRYYSKIGALLTPSIDPSLLTPLSRHHFFVGTDPIALDDGSVLPGLSQLELLMGLSYPAGKAVEEPLITSGDRILDLEADLLLVFKGQALRLMEVRSVPYLADLLMQTARRQDPEGQKKAQQERDRKLLDNENTQRAIREHYVRQGIPIPDDF